MKEEIYVRVAKVHLSSSNQEGLDYSLTFLYVLLLLLSLANSFISYSMSSILYWLVRWDYYFSFISCLLVSSAELFSRIKFIQLSDSSDDDCCACYCFQSSTCFVISFLMSNSDEKRPDTLRCYTLLFLTGTLRRLVSYFVLSILRFLSLLESSLLFCYLPILKGLLKPLPS